LPQELSIVADPDRLTQVFNNLLSNALQHTPADGSILVSARQQDGQLLLSTLDSGTGIPANELENIFGRF